MIHNGKYRFLTQFGVMSDNKNAEKRNFYHVFSDRKMSQQNVDYMAIEERNASSVDRYRIDSHKLIYHVDRVCDWLQGKPIYPVYMEISPTGRCNHRCLYCALDYLGYQKRSLSTDIITARLKELGQLGLKSVMYAGEGEPFMHPDMADIIIRTRQSGMDVAVTTNGVLLRPEKAEAILGVTDWIKVSISGATKETYAKIHRTDQKDFDRVIANLTTAANIRRNHGYKCVLGMQLLLLPENIQEATQLARIARDIGMDYLVIKPYSHNPQSLTQQYKDIKYRDYNYLSEELAAFNTENFNVIFRINTMERWDAGTHNYGRCCSLPFWSYIDAGGYVWGCSAYMGNERFCYGNIYDDTFEAIWTSEKRQTSLEWVERDLDIDQCRVNCRMDKINQYLWELKHPPEHVNFI